MFSFCNIRLEIIIPLQDTHRSFCEKLLKIEPTIRLTGEYIKSKQRVGVKCLVCGHEWTPFPYNLISGEGCPICRRAHAFDHRRKAHEEFVLEIQKLNSDIIINSTYRSAKFKVQCACQVCGNNWEATPSNLLSGFGCPVCGLRKIKEKQRLSFD